MLTAGAVTYGYDANGNQTRRGSDTFTYDHENRVTQTIIGGVTSTSTYNGDGLRMSHTVSGQPTNYTWDVATGLPRVLQDGTNTYVYGLDLISATDGSGAQTYFSYDGLGSTTNLTDGGGNTVATYSYDPFGAIRSQTGSSPNYWQFTGEQKDGDSNFYYLRARYYDTATGRFLSRDPLAGSTCSPLTLNRYVYASNNPINKVDPSGLSSIPPPFPSEKPGPCERPSPPPPCPPEEDDGSDCGWFDWACDIIEGVGDIIEGVGDAYGCICDTLGYNAAECAKAVATFSGSCAVCIASDGAAAPSCFICASYLGVSYSVLLDCARR